LVFKESPINISFIESVDGLPVRYLDVNDKLLEHLEYTREELMQKNPLDVTDGQVLKNAQFLTKMLHQNKKLVFEFNLITKSGKMIPTEGTAILIKSNGSDIVLLMTMDITERKKAEELAIDFETVFNQSRDPMTIIEINEDGSVGSFLKVNDAYVEALGYTKEELVNLTPNEIVAPEMIEKIPLFMEILNQGDSIEGVEWISIRKNKKKIFLSINLQIIPFKGQKVIFASARDMSVQKKIIDELKQAKNQRLKFEAMVSHELRTPLQAILGFTELLDTRVNQLDEDITKSVISMIKKNVSRLENIANTIIDVSDMEYSIYKLNLKTLDFREFMDKIQETHKHPGVNFFPCESINPIFLTGDSKKLHMVFDHLIDNAIRNTNEKNRLITVTPVLLNTSIQITFIDNGAGIAKKNLEKIFEKFVSIQTEYAVDGMGVGLHFVKQIILAHGGTITASSKGVGQGATFTIRLPLKDLL
jgi:PAS domain S-box-containing protein